MRSAERCCGAASSSVGTTTRLSRGFRPHEVENGLLHARDLVDVDDLAAVTPYGCRIVVRSCAQQALTRSSRRSAASFWRCRAGRSREGIAADEGGAYTQRASRLRRESLATPPYGRLHTLALPPSLATRTIACACRGTHVGHSRTIEARSASVDAVGPCIPTRGGVRTPPRARDRMAREISWGGSERSARRSLWA